ncbi:MAG: hydrogenase maturation protease [wastewater metagenome]|nr:hydrogenase maturation protease [Candidatus Loosdrechtia aerotolerans]
MGNIYRGDDAAGITTVRLLKNHAPDHVSIIEESGSGIISHIESWKHKDAIILVDAVSSGTKPGTIHRFDVSVRSLPAKFFRCSTHVFGIAETIELARALNQLPPHSIVYGIEGKCFEMGSKPSAEVEKAIQRVLDYLLQEICFIRKTLNMIPAFCYHIIMVEKRG